MVFSNIGDFPSSFLGVGMAQKNVPRLSRIITWSSIDVLDRHVFFVNLLLQGSDLISVDNTSGFQLNLSKDSLGTSITTAKSGEINVLVHGSESDGRSMLYHNNIFTYTRTESQSFIGVNYGQVADNLPPPEETAKLLKSTSIEKVRLYGADPAIIKALADSGIGIVIGAANGDIPALASDPNFAGNWVNSNVLAYYPASKIIVVTIGNEVVTLTDQNLVSQLLPAMQNVQNAINAASLGGKIKVSTVHSMAVLSQSEPPSAGAFGYGDTMKALLQFLSANGSPFMINPYPFFAYQSDPRPETLAFCLFQPNAGRMDSGTGINYMNMFDAQVDAIHSALNAMGFKDVEIVVAETGWPYKGDSNEVGPSLDNARAYNGNLVTHLRSMVGTPLMPGRSVDTYIFAIYDEDMKPGPGSERAFGLFKPDLSMIYDAGLSKSSMTPAPTPVAPAPSPPITPAPATPVTPVILAPANPKTPMVSPITPVTTFPRQVAGNNGAVASCRLPYSLLIILVTILAFTLVEIPKEE